MHASSGPFEQLIERHRGEILAYLVRLLGDASEAEDVCQDALLRAHRARDRLAPNSMGRAWLYKIATRGALNALKRRTRMRVRTSAVDLDTLAARPAAGFDRRDQLRRLTPAVGQALGRNPIPIVIPCHRVVAGDGTLGGYTGGLHIKKKLLGIEAA